MYAHNGVLFLLVSSAIDVATAVGWCPIECSYVNGYSRWVASRRCTCDGYISHWCSYSSWVVSNWVFVRAMVTAGGLRRDVVRAMVTADGTHAPWLRRYVNTCSYVKWLQQMGCVETLYVRWLQQMEHTHRGCVDTWILGVRTCNGYSRWVASRRCTWDGYSRFTADGTHAPWLRWDVHAW